MAAVLSNFAVRYPDDSGDREPSLMHLLCGTEATVVDEGDLLSSLVSEAARHEASCTATAAMTVWRAASGRLHLRAACSGGPGLGGIASGRNAMVHVTLAEFDAAPQCRCLRTWKADADRTPAELAHARSRV